MPHLSSPQRRRHRISTGRGAHRNPAVTNVNIDTGAGRVVKLEDICDSKSADTVFAVGLDQVTVEKSGRLGADASSSVKELEESAKNVRGDTEQLISWICGVGRSVSPTIDAMLAPTGMASTKARSGMTRFVHL
jgi:hypothetical protein